MASTDSAAQTSTTTTTTKLSGGCLCGSIRYEVTTTAGGGDDDAGGPIYSVICHCLNCKKATGTHMINTSIFRKEQFTLLQGTPKTFRDEATDSGQPLSRFFCGDCGSPVFLTTEAVPGIVAVTSGTLDEGTTWWRPNKEQYIETKSHWVPDLPVIAKEGVVERHQRGPLDTQKY